ncbi:MAG TPA: hypothetical protein VG900_11775 [Hyphomicrobiaceae bacterium]|nr:hypothetical protein [Hyphomicrobiaceae bacterium]
MSLQLRRFVAYWLPLIANLGLIAYLVWQLGLVPYQQRHGELRMFSILYAVGGMVVGASGITAFFHVTANEKGPRRWLALALVNTIVPTLLLLVLLQSG